MECIGKKVGRYDFGLKVGGWSTAYYIQVADKSNFPISYHSTLGRQRLVGGRLVVQNWGWCTGQLDAPASIEHDAGTCSPAYYIHVV